MAGHRSANHWRDILSGSEFANVSAASLVSTITATIGAAAYVL